MSNLRQNTPRSIWTLLRMGSPKNLRVALVWLLYTFLGVGLSFLAGLVINLATSGQVNSPSLIEHGELFAVSASLLIGAMRLVSKDDGLEAFSGRQVLSAVVFGAAMAAQLGYVLLRLVNSQALQPKIADVVADKSIYVAVFVICLVFFITMIDASRLPIEETIDLIENDYKNLSAQMGAPE